MVILMAEIDKYMRNREMYKKDGIDDETIELLIERDRLVDDYCKLLTRINPLTEAREVKRLEISRLNDQICSRIGHKLSKDWYITKAYGKTYNCLSCGKVIGEIEIREIDRFVDSTRNKNKTLDLRKPSVFTKRKK